MQEPGVGGGAVASGPAHVGEQVDVSIILPTKNGATTIDGVLDAIEAQQTDLTLEILVVDSGSTDGTLDMLRRRAVRIHEIRPEEFSHSRTRNLGASLARATRYLVFQNQDAIPANESWLTSLVHAVESDRSIRAACAIELDPNLTGPFNVCGIASTLFGNSLVGGIYVMDQRLLDLWSGVPKAQLRLLFAFATVSAIFERRYFDSHPFDALVEYGEDLHWAVSTVRAGEKVACTSSAQVFHAPIRTDREYFSRLKKDVETGMMIFGPTYRRKYSRVAWALGLHRLLRLASRSGRWMAKVVRGF